MRQFSLLEITSGLPDDSREEDERATERRLRDLRGRVRAARPVVASTPGLAEILASDWRKPVMFYTRYGLTEEMFRHGVPGEDVAVGVFTDASRHSMNALVGGDEHPRGILPSAA